MKRARLLYKHPLTLLEVMIALTLTAILLSALFSYYRKNASLNIEVRAAKEKIFSRQTLDLRLSSIFSDLQLATSAASKDKPTSFLYTASHAKAEGDVLIFQYDNGIDQDPSFCNDLDAMLILDRDHNLCLISWPNHEALAPTLPIEKGRKEILLRGVQAAHFRFFDAREKMWKSSWTKEQRALPVMIELKLAEVSSSNPDKSPPKSASQELSFVYFLPAEPIPIK